MKVFEYYRKQNPDLLESDANFSDSDGSDSESENEEEIENSEIRIPNDITLRFWPIFEQTRKIGRPSKNQSGSVKRTKIRQIPESSYDHPKSLLYSMYGKKIITELVTGTNERAKKLHPDNTFFPISESDLEQFLGLFLIISAYKP